MSSLEELLQSTINQHGYWLVSHRDVIEADLRKALREHGWFMTFQMLEKHDSPFCIDLYAKIENARKGLIYA